MTPEQRIRRLYRNFFLFTGGIAYFILVPISSCVFYRAANLTPNELIWFVPVTFAVSFLGALGAFISNKVVLRPFISYYRKFANNQPFTEDEYIQARHRFFSVPYTQAISGALRWLILMPIVITITIYFSDTSSLKTVNMFVIMVFNIFVTVVLYLIVSERLLATFARLGIFNKDIEDSKLKKNSMPVKLTILAIGIMSSIVVLLSMMLFNSEYNMIKHSYAAQMAGLVSVSNKQINEFYAKMPEDAASLLWNKEIVETLSEGRTDGLPLELRYFANSHSYLESASIADLSSVPNIIASSDEQMVGKTLDADIYEKNISNALEMQPHVGKVHLSPTTGNPVVLYTIPFHKNESPLAILCLSIKADGLADKFLKGIKVGKSGYLVLMEDGNKIVAAADSKMIMKDLTSDNLLKRLSEVEQLAPVEFFHNKRYQMIVSMPNNEHHYNLAAIVDLSEIENDVIVYAKYILILGTFLIVAGAFILSWVIKFSLRPVKDCENFIEAVSRGDLTGEIVITANDEIGDMIKRMFRFSERLKGIIRNIVDISSDMASSSEEMSATSNSFSDIAQNQAASAQQVTATMEEMAAGMDSVASSAEEQYESIDHLVFRMNELSRSINEMGGKLMEAIVLAEGVSQKAKVGEESIGSLGDSMNKIITSSREMATIINIIGDISEQINLLSLNAAIEAARAGEAGRGFAVVADEVSKLADQTATSIKQIDRSIAENNQEINRGMQASEGTIAAITSIIESVNSISEMIMILDEFMKKQLEANTLVNKEAESMKLRTDEMKGSTSEQKNAVKEIVRSIGEINDLTQRNAGGAEEIAANATNVAQLAEKLREGISFFKI